MIIKCKSLSLLIIGILYFGCKQKEVSRTQQATATSQDPANKEISVSINLDKSPMDICYYPVDYPKSKMSGTSNEPIVARIIYSRPKKDGRIIFGNVLKYGSRWRLGANEATEIEFFKDVRIQNTLIKKNRYVIYCIPQQKTWTVILNNDLLTWGLKIDSTKDVYKFEIPVLKTSYAYEYFTMEFEKAFTGMHLVMIWDTVKAMLLIRY